MPSSARKSSVGTARRAIQKAHIPYRGDNPEVGKKTGIAVQHVQRKSDGFEPFEEVMQQADGRTPPRPKGRKKKSVVSEDDDEDGHYSDEDDEFGEMSMQLDSPAQNLASMRHPTTPTTNGRSGSSRPVARSSNVDFDKIPSPRPRTMANAGPGPSRLSRSYVARDDEASSESQQDNGFNEHSMTIGEGGYDDYEPPSATKTTPRRTSFTHLDQDDDDDDENEPFNDFPEQDDRRSETPKPVNNKGKHRAFERNVEDDEMEDDISRGLSNVDQGQGSQDEPDEPEPEPEPRKKKVKITDEKQRTKTKSESKKENRVPDHRDGVRRSKRQHYKPLDYWRGEKVVYGRPDFSSQEILVPHIREIIRIPKEQSEPLGKRKRARSRSKTAQPSAPGFKGMPFDPEEGWDDDTPSNAKVLDYRTGQEVERRIAWTAKMVNPSPVANNSWSFDKIFGDADFIAAGQLVIPPNSRKPSKATKDNTYIFYVIEGAVNLKVHDTSLVLASGGMFMVPRGNTYFIENISQRDAKLFFTQARKTMNDEDERLIALANRQKKKPQRSSSAGAGMLSGVAHGRASSIPDGDGTPLAMRAASMKI